MDDLKIIVDEIKATILESEKKRAFDPINEETFEMVKIDLKHVLNRYGYTDDDINVIVKAHDENPTIIKIVLEDRSHRGKMLLEYMDYISRQE